MAEARRIVIVAPYLPTSTPDNAGVGYLNALRTSLRSSDVAFIVPDTPRNRHAAAHVDAPRHVLVPITVPSRIAFLRALRENVERMTPVRPPAGFVAGISKSAPATDLLRRAHVVDAQWPSSSAILHRLASLSPDARHIATLHDVASQGFGRELSRARTLPRKTRLAASVVHARIVERRVSRAADTIVVFSEKDRELLPRTARSRAVRPPVAQPPSDMSETSKPTPPTSPSALFVGPLRRAENRESLEWFTAEVWPRVRRSVPDARLVVAGTRSSTDAARITDAPGIEMLGFVDDLDELYRRSSVVIAPIQSGAGVKFKVLEAMARGVPVVTTSIGAEGIGDSEFTLDAHDGAGAFADAVIEAMGDSAKPRRLASQAREWLDARYDRRQFEREIHAIYGIRDHDRDPDEDGSTDRDDSAAIAVVIPVRNGEHGIGNALAALARQKEARHLEVIVSDNGSTDRTAEVATSYRSAFARLRVIDSGDRAGVSHARNVGLRAASVEKVLICDHDDEVRAGWVEALSAGLDRVDVVGGCATSVRISGRHAALEREQDEASALRTVFDYLPYVLGGCMGVRRSAALSVGGFDEAFLRGHEEADFCWRLQQAGFTIDGTADAVLDYRQRDRASGAARQRYHSARTRILLWTRHAPNGGLSSVSFRGSVRHAILSLRYVALLIPPSTRFPAARAIGWAFGTLDGHLRYRMLGRPPLPALMTGDQGDST